MAYITCKVVIITHINTNATILDALTKQSKDVLSDYQLQNKQRRKVWKLIHQLLLFVLLDIYRLLTPTKWRVHVVFF